MASIINASSTGSGGLISTGDASGVLQLQNNGSAALTVNTASQVLIGTTSAVTGTPALQISKTSAADYGQLFLNSTDSVAINKGGGISFGGSYTGTSPTYWAGIFGFKETATDGEYGGYLAFNTRPNGGGGTERMRISSAGNITTPSNSAFIAYMTASSTALTIPFNATSLNRGSNFNTSTYTVTAPVTGLYWFNLIVSYDGSGTNPNAGFISLYVNGGRARDFFEANTAWTTNTEVHSSTTYYLNAGDTAVAYNSGAGNIQGGNNPNYYSLFSGYLIG